ncbi:energy-coupling factor transporter transmembrane component T family protein [Bariatricus sp. SGI.154]|uniref:energy-coupling factor transporter transmembrane component T family protein n=1 Tax=Bariatricus sp. SGI.154 TaxID=3420549 RepID=UPI003D0317CB
MIRDITIGQYYARGSVVHGLDPRTKLMGVLIYIIVLFLVKNPWWYLACLAVILVLYHAARVPLPYLLKGLRGIVILLMFTFFFRLISTPGVEVAHFWIFTITKEGVVKAVSLTSRIALMITGASLLSYTSTPRELADGLEKAFSFLEKIHVPVHDMAVIVMIAFRFIPIMIEEMNALMDAQAARGVEFEKCSVFKKCKNVFSLLVPLFLSTVRRASDLAMAMEARGYTGDRQTSRMYPLIYKSNDRIAYAMMGIWLTAGIGIRVFL